MGFAVGHRYEVRLHNAPHECGGAYVKLLDATANIKPEDFTDQTPYIIMFGPDKCGSNNKVRLAVIQSTQPNPIRIPSPVVGSDLSWLLWVQVHFIFRHRNPLTNKYEEKHLKNPAMIKNDKYTHLYTLVRCAHRLDILNTAPKRV